jgi:hypothetical protein
MRRCRVVVSFALFLTGCPIELTKSYVGQIVERGMKDRQESPAFRMRVVNRSAESGAWKTSRCAITKSSRQDFVVAFDDGAKSWTTRDGCVLLAAGGAYAEVFCGLADPPDEEVGSAMRWITERWVAENKVVLDWGAREGPWSGDLVTSTPRAWRPFLPGSAIFYEKETYAPVRVEEFDAKGALVREERAAQLTKLGKNDYATPSLPPGCRAVRFNAAAAKAQVPAWAPCPRKTLEILAEPAVGMEGEIVSFTFSRGGHLFAAFARKKPERVLIAPDAREFAVGTTRLYLWWVGWKEIFRVVAGDLEWTVFTTLPPDLVYTFVEANLTR